MTNGSSNSRERRLLRIALVLLTAAITLVFYGRHSEASLAGAPNMEDDEQTNANAERMLEEGRQTFRFDTFGDEAFWTDALQLHKAIAGASSSI